MRDQGMRVCVLVFLFGLALSGCTIAISPRLAGIEVEKNVTLPLTVENVWYRTEKVRLLGLAYEETGKMTVTENAVEFAYDKGNIRIPRESIRRVVLGKLSPDMGNVWVIVYYAGSDEDEVEVAAFKFDGVAAFFSGSGKDSKIYSAVLYIMREI